MDHGGAIERFQGLGESVQRREAGKAGTASLDTEVTLDMVS